MGLGCCTMPHISMLRYNPQFACACRFPAERPWPVDCNLHSRAQLGLCCSMTRQFCFCSSIKGEDPLFLQKKKRNKKKQKSAVYLPGFIQPPAKVLTAVAPSRLTKKIINRASKNGGGGGHFLSAANRYCALTCQSRHLESFCESYTKVCDLWASTPGVRMMGSLCT